MKAGPLCEKSMALKGRPGPKQRVNSSSHSCDNEPRWSAITSLIFDQRVWSVAFTQQGVSNWVVMLPYKEVVDRDVGDLRLGSIGPQQSQPVLRGYHIVGVDGVLGQFQSIQELLELHRGQRVDVLTHHRGLPLVAVGSGPSKFALSAVVTRKVAWKTVKILNQKKKKTSTKIITHQYTCRSDWRI